MAPGTIEAEVDDLVIATAEGRAPAIGPLLRRLEGQIRGLTGMIEQERPCIDTLTQISATQRALQGVGLALLTDYLRHAHATGTLTDDTVLDAASTAITQLIRS